MSGSALMDLKETGKASRQAWLQEEFRAEGPRGYLGTWQSENSHNPVASLQKQTCRK